MKVHLGHDPYFQICDSSHTLSDLSSRLGIRRPFLLYVGSFARRKNLPNMIDAFAMTRKRRPEVQFVIVGGPSGRDDVFPAEVPEGVVVAGRVNRQELRALYNNAELLLFTTLYEGFGVPVLEAMSCGCPVVTSPVTSLPEVAGDAALYAAPDQAGEIAEQALRVLEKNQLRKILVENGLKQVSRFDWKTTANQTIDIYHLAKCEGQQ
jgi:glycosyltransferase involved in cell wall biosynthesis